LSIDSPNSATAAQAHYDIAIIGGGMVGASLALGLAQSMPGLSITVLEAFAIPAGATTAATAQPSYDARSTALSMSSKNYYQHIGMWSKLEPQITPIHDIHVSDRGHFGTVRLNYRDQRVDALGYMIENRHLGNALLAQMADYPKVDWRCPAKVERLEMVKNGALLHCDQSDEAIKISANLVVIADGGRSDLISQLGIARDTHDYEQLGIIANISSDQPHQNKAYERFTQRGPMALLPLDGQRSALIWTLEQDQAERILALDDAAFLAELQSSFGYRAGNFTKIGARHSYPFIRVQAREQVRSNVVLLGNAAHTLHPVAGQGFNLGLRDAVILADALLSNPNDIAEVLATYAKRRALDQTLIIGFTDNVIKLFSTDNALFSIVRNSGLLMLDKIPLMKHQFARQTMGLSSRLARLKEND